MKPLAADADYNGIPDGAAHYPAFLLSAYDYDHDAGPDSIFDTSVDANGNPASCDDVDGPAPPKQPIARMFGSTKIFGQWATVNISVFEPGITIRGPDRKPFVLNPNLGYPTFITFQDPTVPPAPGAVSDSCAPTNMRLVTFGLARDNPCTGLDTATTRGNCPSEIESALEQLGYPLLPCESDNNIDEDGDGRINDGCPALGTPETGEQCNNNTDDDGEDQGDGLINDGCPQVGDVSEASYIGSGGCAGAGQNEGGCAIRQNSALEGTVTVPFLTQSLRDADGDGIDNDLDVCALHSNPGWNPRALDFANDNDNDGLPNECDPAPNGDCGPQWPRPPACLGPNSPAGCEKGIVGPDYDQDCYANREDNCPLTNQLSDPSKPASYNVPAQPNDNTPVMSDRDGDGIGDACDITSCPTSDTPAYFAADCQLFGVSARGTSADGTQSQDGG